jgi:hypothetical protein
MKRLMSRLARNSKWRTQRRVARARILRLIYVRVGRMRQSRRQRALRLRKARPSGGLFQPTIAIVWIDIGHPAAQHRTFVEFRPVQHFTLLGWGRI